jgi:hypothetical protein
VNGFQAREQAAVASPEEDPNVSVISCSSPPCFLHELDPSFLGYLTRYEVLRLLQNLLAAEWAAGTTLERAWLHAMLRRHIGHISGGDGEPSLLENPATVHDEPIRPMLRRLASDLREALPRIQDHALRRDLEEVSASLEHVLHHCGVVPPDEH